jgi:hypothetical protein
VDRRLRASSGLAFIAIGILLSTPNAAAAPKDAAAIKLADDAINRDYLATNFAEAEKKLRSALTMCAGGGCTPVVVGRVHRDLGVVLIAGLNRADEGKQELAEAIRADPDVQLEKDLTTPEIEATFKALKTGGLPPPKGGDMVHTPPPEQRVLTAVPIYVELPEGVSPFKVIARYKPYGTPDWKTLELHKMGTGYGGEVPCMDVGTTTGDFLYYVQATDGGGEVVGTSGSRTAPNKVTIKNEALSGEPPHLPGRAPPSRCREAGDCPPGMPGCGKKAAAGRGWGATCSTDEQCGKDFWCKNGTCENGVRTDADEEPKASGKYCDTSAECDKGERCSSGRTCERAPEKAKKIWLSLNVGQDFSFIGTQANVCGTEETLAANQYTCYDQYSGLSYEGYPYESAPGTGNAINGGVAPATTRIMAGIEFLLGDNVTLGARLGYALRNGSGNTLAAFHGEGRVAFWFGREPFTRQRVRPFIVVAGGLAEIDNKFAVPIIEGNLAKSPHPTQTLTVWRESGMAFAGGGLGLMIPTGGPGQGFTAEMKIIALFPDSGIAMSPTIGYALGL